MIPFKELKGQHAALEAELLAAVRRAADAAAPAGEVEAFEATFAALHGVPFAAAVANAADAVELALLTGGVGPGDEVLTTGFVPASTLAGLRKRGATPVFVDVNPITATMCPAAAAAAVTSRTKAILPVHTHGHPAEMTPLLDLARSRKLLLVEDCTEAAGARYDGRPVGTLGDLGVFAFEEGGVILTGDPKLSAWLWRLRRGDEPDHPRDHDEPVIPISPLAEAKAAVLSVRLARLEANVLVRRRFADLYWQLLGGVTTPQEQEWARHVYTRYAVRLRDRDGLCAALRAAGVEAAVPAPPAGGADLPATARLAAETLLLPLHVGMTEEQARQVVRAVSASLAQSPPLKKVA